MMAQTIPVKLKAMSFSGRSLIIVRNSLIDAIAKINNQIGTCPDVYEFGDDIDQCKHDIKQIERILRRVNKSMGVPEDWSHTRLDP